MAALHYKHECLYCNVAVPIEDSSLVEYMESTPDELIDKLPGSNRQVTLLVFREGDQLNFFRVVDRGDGTLTPLSESLRCVPVSSFKSIALSVRLAVVNLGPYEAELQIRCWSYLPHTIRC